MKKIIPLFLMTFTLLSYGDDQVNEYKAKIEAVLNSDSVKVISQQLIQAVKSDGLPFDQVSLNGVLKGLEGINLEGINLEKLESLKVLVEQSSGEDQEALNRAFQETLDPLLEKLMEASSDTAPAAKVLKSIKNISDAMLSYIGDHLKEFTLSVPKT